jgi:hypothetical protein
MKIKILFPFDIHVSRTDEKMHNSLILDNFRFQPVRLDNGLVVITASKSDYI